MLKAKEIEFVIDEENEEASLRIGNAVYRILFDFQALFLFYRTFNRNQFP